MNTLDERSFKYLQKIKALRKKIPFENYDRYSN